MKITSGDFLKNKTPHSHLNSPFRHYGIIFCFFHRKPIYLISSKRNTETSKHLNLEVCQVTIARAAYRQQNLRDILKLSDLTEIMNAVGVCLSRFSFSYNNKMKLPLTGFDHYIY